jgi:hypothetical protein
MNEEAQYISGRLSDRFWDLIDLSRRDWEAFELALSALDQRERVQLVWTYEAAVSVLRTPEHDSHAAPDLVEDGLHELAIWIVAQGRATYMDILEHPEHMPSDAPEPAYPVGSAYGAAIRAASGELAPPGSEHFFQ